MKSKKNTPESGDIRGWAKLAKEKPTEEVDKLLKEDERRYNRGKNGKFFGKNGHYDEDGSEDEELGDEWDDTIEEGKEEKKIGNNNEYEGEKMDTNEDFGDRDGERREDDKEDNRNEAEVKEERELENRKYKNRKTGNKQLAEGTTKRNDESKGGKNVEEDRKKNKKTTRQLSVSTGDEDESSKDGKGKEKRTNGRKRGVRSNSEVEEDMEKGPKNKEKDKTGGSKKKKAKNMSKMDTTKKFKKVNSMSMNRRECSKWTELTEYDNEGANTPDQSNSSSFFRHAKVTRVTMKITLEASDDPRGMAMQEIKRFYTELVKADDTLQIYTWKTSEESKGRIRKPEKMPKNLREMQTYSSKLYVFDNKNKMTIYPMVRIGHDKPLEDIREEIREWSRETNNRIFGNMLQCESSSEIGWFLYSTQKMDGGALADEISDMLGVNVGLRWKMINLGTKGKVSEDKKVSAMAIEVDTKYKWQAQKKFIQFYGKEIQRPDYYPNGIRLRFIKAKKDAINAKERAKLDKLRERQKAFLSTIKATQTWDIVQLDYSAEIGQPTLRQMIMEVTSEQYPGTPLFHSVDLDWRGDGHVFEYSPKMQDEAECMVNYLQPYLEYHFPEAQVMNYFTEDSIERCSDIKVDEETGQVIDINSGMAELDLEKEDGIIGFSLTFSKTAEKELLQRPEKDRAAPFPGDSDSVSTLDGARTYSGGRIGNRNGSTQTFVPNPAPRVIRKEQQKGSNGDEVSVVSSTSTVTWQSLREVDNRLLTLEKDTNEKLDKIMKLLGAPNKDKEDGNTTSTAASHTEISSSSRESMQGTGGSSSSSGGER